MLSFNDSDVLPPALQRAMERVRDGADWMPRHQLEETLDAELGSPTPPVASSSWKAYACTSNHRARKATPCVRPPRA